MHCPYGNSGRVCHHRDGCCWMSLTVAMTLLGLH